MPSHKRFDPARFDSNNGGFRPTVKPAPPDHHWGALMPEEAGLYLASPEWAARKAQYFAWVRAQGFEPACQVCFVMLKDTGHLDVHHHGFTGVLVARPHRAQFLAWEDHTKLVPLCREHHVQVHKHLTKISKQRGYLVSDSGWSESREALRAVRNVHAKAPTTDRLGLIPTAPPGTAPPRNAHRSHKGPVGR